MSDSSHVEIRKSRSACKDIQNADDKRKNRNDKARRLGDGHCVHTQKFKPESADAIPEQIENHQDTGVFFLIVSLPHPHAENRADSVPHSLVEECCAEPVSAAACPNVIIDNLQKFSFDSARIGYVHAEREELQRLVRDRKSERLLVDEVAPSAYDLTDENGHYDEVDDVEIVGLFFVTEREKHRAEKSAHESADYGYAALPNGNDIDEFIPAFESVVSEIFVCARNDVQKSCKYDCKRN